jgi:hypothetical protein
MNNLYQKYFLKSNIITLIIIFFFSFFINYYYSSFGVFPIDTFFHYDSAARILQGEFPIRDFWIVSGLVIDLIQSLFFKFFGVNWFAYIFHSSISNFLISLIIYHYFQSIKINKINSLLFTCCFSTLAYTVSGTPFVDHHAIFFLLASTVLIIKAIDSEKNYLWFFIVLFFFLSFLTKQVPAAYIILTQGVIISAYIFHVKKYSIIKYLILSFSLIIFFTLTLLFFLNIELKDFYIQYIHHPRSIGSSRFLNFELTFNGFFNDYKFIVLPLILTFILKINKCFKKNFQLSKKEIYIFLILCSFVFSSIFHQILTKNQIFIYFLIPILFGLLFTELQLTNYKFKKYCSTLLLITLIFITLKYHIRYNENRKFHELESVNFDEAVPAHKINKVFHNLSWLNPVYDGEPDNEILLIKEGISYLEKEKDEIMLFTHYLFLDSITKKKLNYPTRSFTTDGASMPVVGMKYFKSYKSFLLNKIKDKKIKKIYFFRHEGISEKTLTDYLNPNCYNKLENNIFILFKLKCN